jgi:nucleoside-diphosphate-sugar epimerase
MRILILGVNGFIGHALTERILTSTDWEVSGLDMASDKIEPFLGAKRFQFLEGDIGINREWIEYQVKKADVVLPLVAIATPAAYISRPLEVFELDFEQNLRIVRQCVQYGKRIVFASTSEVYGMCPDAEFDEETSPMVYGPINKQRWIYSASKQLLDRVIYAYGQTEGLRFSLFRPFNWIGPNLDNIDSPKEGSSRVLTQFLHNILYGEPIKLVDGGRQRRSFTFISDGVECLMRILENRDGRADSGIFNIGNPANDISVGELAERLVAAVSAYPGYEHVAATTAIEPVSSEAYYGAGYQDMQTRVPSVRRARERLGWEPRVSLDDALRLTLDFYLGARRWPVTSNGAKRPEVVGV